MQRSFTRNIDSLADIFSFLEGVAAEFNLDGKTVFAVNMAVEELFTNMVKYNPDGTSDISLELLLLADSVSVGIVDTDSEGFDITALEKVDTNASLEERRPGGLGIHLVKSLMDEVSYEYKNRVTRIRLVKNITI
jgi:anti-sigma regulatory factor (Ser/Thr protein kinase)